MIHSYFKLSKTPTSSQRQLPVKLFLTAKITSPQRAVSKQLTNKVKLQNLSIYRLQNSRIFCERERRGQYSSERTGATEETARENALRERGA